MWGTQPPTIRPEVNVTTAAPARNETTPYHHCNMTTTTIDDTNVTTTMSPYDPPIPFRRKRASIDNNIHVIAEALAEAVQEGGHVHLEGDGTEEEVSVESSESVEEIEQDLVNGNINQIIIDIDIDNVINGSGGSSSESVEESSETPTTNATISTTTETSTTTTAESTSDTTTTLSPVITSEPGESSTPGKRPDCGTNPGDDSDEPSSEEYYEY